MRISWTPLELETSLFQHGHACLAGDGKLCVTGQMLLQNAGPAGPGVSTAGLKSTGIGHVPTHHMQPDGRLGLLANARGSVGVRLTGLTSTGTGKGKNASSKPGSMHEQLGFKHGSACLRSPSEYFQWSERFYAL